MTSAAEDAAEGGTLTRLSSGRWAALAWLSLAVAAWVAGGQVSSIVAEVTPTGQYSAASALLSLPSSAAPAAPETVVALFDSSLSMQWEKLEASFRALESLLRSLSQPNSFNLLSFNDKVAQFAPDPVATTPETVEKALAFLRAQQLRGGTNIQAALDAALAQNFANDPYIVLIGDLNATRGAIATGKLAEWYAAKPKRPRTYVFAVGDDANRKAEEWQGYQQRFPAMLDKKTFLSVDEYAYFGGGFGRGANLKLALAYGMIFNEMLRHTDFLKFSAHTMGVSTLDYNPTAASFNTTGLLFKLYGDQMGTGSIPVEVSG